MLLRLTGQVSQQKLTGLPQCKAQGSRGWGGRGGDGQGCSEERVISSSLEDQGRLHGGGGVWVGPRRTDFEPSPSPLAWSPGQAEYVWVERQLLCRGSCGWDGDRKILTLHTLGTLARE